MRSALFWVIAVAVVAAVVVTYAAERGGPAGGPVGPAALIGTPARSFPARDLAGKDVSLADYRGKVVLLNLWASWCTPCRQEMPALEQLYRENRARGLVVLGVDQGESKEAATAFVREHGVTFDVLLDEEQQYGRAYAAVGLPTTLVIDRSGRIVHGYDGALTLSEMREAVDGTLRAT